MLESNTESVKQAIRDLLARKGGGVSFVELEEIPGFTGDREFGPLDNNILLWQGISKAAVQALIELQDAGEIVPSSSTPLVYSIDGKMLSLPLVRQARKYKTLHWLPVVYWTPAQLAAAQAKEKKS